MRRVNRTGQAIPSGFIGIFDIGLSGMPGCRDALHPHECLTAGIVECRAVQEKIPQLNHCFGVMPHPEFAAHDPPAIFGQAVGGQAGKNPYRHTPDKWGS